MKEFDHRNLWAEELQIDEEAERTLFVERCKALARRVELVFVYSTLVLVFLLVATMVVRCVPATYHYLTSSPAPRSPAPQAIAKPQPNAFEADVRPTGQVR